METKRREHKVYNALECCVFRKTKEEYGGLSNMASGFPLVVNNVKILSSEALYQACRFPHMPDVQERVIREKSPMTAKMITKPYRNTSRPDWNDARIKIMKWCIRVKLAQNFVEFGKLLESTFDKPIVEDSSKDDFWGAIRQKEDSNIIKGTNALGRLLMELRLTYNQKRYSSEMFVIEPLDIPDFKLLGEPIQVIDARESFLNYLQKEMKFFDVADTKAHTYITILPQPTIEFVHGRTLSPKKPELTGSVHVSPAQILTAKPKTPKSTPKLPRVDPTLPTTPSQSPKTVKAATGKRANKAQTTLF
ncbi:NADAR family protein [Dyadobacter bucti]|uniref:NADAR family protein n=1 Tax=Dyadobacter bucti TaxID=2572203 RepID=UPI0011097359|nr:NADAR family protein [Dyadobacter bucti]